jgi:Mg-chelatase subunit ChlD
MAMFRRPRKSSPPLRRKQQEIARQEAELHDKLDRLENMVTKGRSIPQKKSRAQAEQAMRANKSEKRYEVSLALDGASSFEASRRTRRPRALRKERREGRMMFLILLAALATAVIWLISHLHP